MQPNPTQSLGDVTTIAEFRSRLRQLKAWSGHSFRALERRARLAGDVLPASTISAMLGNQRRGLPREETVAAFTRACGCTRGQTSAWLQTRKRLAVTAEQAAHSVVASSKGTDPPAASAASGSPPSDTAPPLPLRSGDPTTASRAPKARRKRPKRGWRVLAMSSMTLVALCSAAGSSGPVVTSDPRAGDLVSEVRRCPGQLAMNHRGPCVQRLQRMLRGKGLALPADGWYGPFTKQRVTVFQAYVGLPTTGTADQDTLQALRTGEALALPHWPAARIEERLREAFPTEHRQATELARCLSYLDPLWTYKDGRGVRRWGLFQYSDLELLEMGASPVHAMNPEWNIRTARVIWRRTGDFRHWECRSSGAH
ncbi:hypothetical protein GCM10009678_14340 [Actinomadura kijaniata]|uniref:Peptidoglycan binding-like domain-containing protein n=1 Tax=Actinomadura namibiensis TaxID=182080 RepID=A0A7W3LR15_ACTNM|nr:peptidoglycan-binding domain-containing protein [Actinomadura namibiensis]MBA8952605.1 hypothetical protein [Actinomadura namibiensis]